MGAVRDYGYDSSGVFTKRLPNRQKTTCYNTWIDILQRCYSSKWKNKHETYKDVTLCEEWHDYQMFALWYYRNYKVGHQIDKDILSDYYKVTPTYSPKTCRMVPRDINMILVNRAGKSRNMNLPLGVCENTTGGFITYCNNGEGKTLNLGTTYCITEAAELYTDFKENLIKNKANHYIKEGVIDDVLHKALISYKVTN